MSDTNELRLKIAKLRGWRMDEAWDSPADTGLCAPKGDYVLSVPDWPNDPGAALALMPVGCSLNRCGKKDWPGEWECTMLIDWFLQENITVYADTPEMAICLWYVEYEAALEAQAVCDE
jgi:hypothetical protein